MSATKASAKEETISFSISNASELKEIASIAPKRHSKITGDRRFKRERENGEKLKEVCGGGGGVGLDFGVRKSVKRKGQGFCLKQLVRVLWV